MRAASGMSCCGIESHAQGLTDTSVGWPPRPYTRTGPAKGPARTAVSVPRLFRAGFLVHRLHRRDDRLVGIADHREDDPVVDRIHLEHLEVQRLAFLHRVARVLDVGDSELR